MAPRQVLAALAGRWRARGGAALVLDSIGGVEAVRRVTAAVEPFDLVFVAEDAIMQLHADGRIVPGSAVALMRSQAVLAIPAGAPRPDIGSEQALREALSAASAIGVSSGPSGRALRALLARWKIAPQVLEAPPGVPVATLLAEGNVALGVQQESELINVPGIEIVAALPAPVAIATIFSGAIVAGSQHAEPARQLLHWLASPDTDADKRRYGMQPVTESCKYDY